MCQKNDLPLSLKSDTFGALHSDFDQVLRSTLTGMDETGQDVAEINIKVKITLTDDSAPDYSVAGGQQTREITKPKFEHTVSAVIQRKEKRTGTLAGNYELVWDRETCRYVMRPIDNGQMDLFDRAPEPDEVESGSNEPEQPALPAGNAASLPEAGDVIEADYRVVDDKPEEAPQEAEEEAKKSVDRDAFDWLLQFAGKPMKVLEAMGNYTVRTVDNKVILSSAASPDATFYCPADKLAPHVGHEIACAIHFDDGANENRRAANVSIECLECDEVLFSMDAPLEEAEENDGYPYQEPDEEGGEE